MFKGRVSLVAQEGGSCPLFPTGEKMVLDGRELIKGFTKRVCCEALSSLYPAIQKILETAGRDGKLKPADLTCSCEGCKTKFRLDVYHEGAKTVQLTRRMERGAEQATQIMKAAGPFLARLPTNVAKEIIGAATVRRFRPREVILQQGKVGEHLHIVGDGEVEVVRTSKDDSTEVLLVTLGTGECFGEMSLLTGEVTSATVRSKGDSTILLLDRERLETLLGSCPALGRVFSKLLADRLKASNVSLESELDRGILGKLSLISMIDLVQTLNASRRTGMLILTHRGMEATLGFRDGRMVGAKVADLTGEEAFFALLGWPDGDFCFEQSEVQDAGDIQMDTMGLLMEGLRRMDDLRRGDKA